MNSQKISNDLNLALDLPNNIRSKTLDLDVGFNSLENTWEVIVKYSGSLSRIEEELGATAVELLNEYAIITIADDKIELLPSYEEIEFIEKPRRLEFSVTDGRIESCILPLQTATYNLYGDGVLVAIIDSGIDYAHPDFRNNDGTTRIELLWDQTIHGNPPENYKIGSIYTREKINEALEQPDRSMQLQIVPSTDFSGHGTHVAGIAAGNGRGSQGRYKGIASNSSLLIVKIGTSVNQSFPRTTQLMEAVDFVIRYAILVRKPIVINLSFGNNYGSHDGNSVLEYYLDDIANLWKTSIVVGTGNEGDAAHHAAGILNKDEPVSVELSVGKNEPTFNLQIWKNYFDDFGVEIIAPSGRRIGPIPQILGSQRFVIDKTQISLFFGMPSPFSRSQEIYMEFIPEDNYVASGIWTFRLIPRVIVIGNYNMWLPTGELLGPNTKFYKPEVNTTLTIPSTANRVISVGAYNSITESEASFSGRGYTRGTYLVKPDIVAPGVDITSASPGGGYTSKTGTSMATPFVTGCAALLMQWGIVEDHDPYLYGEKMKSVLIAGTRKLRVTSDYPNQALGFGALCLRDSFNWMIDVM